MINLDAFREHCIINTDDGSFTLHLPQLGEHYHSDKGAISESKHVYIATGLLTCTKKEIHVLEMGFGTGLNALLTALETDNSDCTIHYTTLEKYPLSAEILSNLNYTKQLEGNAAQYWKAIHEARWNVKTAITPQFNFLKLDCDIQDFEPVNPFDVIYYDAFAPSVQPELWSEERFKNLYQWTNSEGILTTYCAKGDVRRAFIAAGFNVERLAGPENGKREILRARK